MSEGHEHIALREYIERILDEREKIYDAREKVIVRTAEEREKALILTAKELERRLTDLNELRREYTSDRMSDREQFVQKTVHDAERNSQNDRIYKLEVFQSKTLGFGAALILLAGVFGAIISRLFLK